MSAFEVSLIACNAALMAVNFILWWRLNGKP